MLDREVYVKQAVLSLTLLLIAAFAAFACSSDDKSPPSTPGAASSTVTSGGSPAPAITVTTALPVPATFHVLAGRNEGNRDVEAYMPADIRIRAGDTIEWTARGIEGHTITFGDGDDVLFKLGDYLVPNPADPTERIFNPKVALRSEAQGPIDGSNAFTSSGFIGVPAEATYSLTFVKEGLYTYLCLVHPFTMTGTVSVEPAGGIVDSPETVSARGQADLAKYMAELADQARNLAANAQSAPGPGGSSIHYVQVGAITDHGQIAVYTPGGLDIAVGDTVIFQNDDRNFHNVIFKGSGELPSGIGILADPSGRGINFSLANASAKAVDPPPGGFDDRTFLSSGSMGVLQPRLTWTLRFTTPGTYVYACTIHVLGGMTGVINVK
jgi:plastocyanin